MKYHFIISFIFISFSLFPTGAGAQQKGATPIPSVVDRPPSAETFAVVVGISDYQDEGIPDLRFADKDAEAFAAFLQSPAGGGLDEDHLRVLLNEDATVAQFAIQLDWLMEVAGENDRVIVYFSGHGDVERKTITQPGYLLCWDAPAKIYLAGGALALPMFQDVITTLSAQNKAKVVVITDACRSGKLSGSSVGGAQITGSNLAKQYANEIKILSCQPDEYSIEGEQWGGGRGAFSYHLLEGLSGMADGNADNTVNLREIRNYLEENVAKEVAPQNQNPVVVGNLPEKLTDVFPDFLAAIKAGKKEQMQLFTATESRGIEEDVLVAADTNIVEMYFAFKKALEDKRFLYAAADRAENDYADYYYEKLSQEPQMKRLHSTMRRNYAAALQDDAQQVMNNWMKKGVDQIKTPSKEFKEKVKTFPRYLDRAAELLGSEHYMYTTLIARKHFFEGYILFGNFEKRDSQEGEKALKSFREALRLVPEMPQAYWQISRTFMHKFSQPDSAIVYANKAIELYPSWILPYTDLAFALSLYYYQFDKAKPYMEQAMKIDSTSPQLWNAKAVYNYFQGSKQEAEKCLRKVIQYDSSNVRAYHNLGHIHNNRGQYDEAEKYYLKAVHFDSTDYLAVNNLGAIYFTTNRLEEAEKCFKLSLALESDQSVGHESLGDLYLRTQIYEDAEKHLKKALEINPVATWIYLKLGDLYQMTGQWKKLEALIRKAEEIELEDAEEHLMIGKLYYKLNRSEKVEWHFNQYIQSSSQNKRTLSIGRYYFKHGDQKLAEKYLRKSLEIDPGSYGPYWDLAWLYFSFGEYEMAAIVIDEGIEQNPNKFNLKGIKAMIAALSDPSDQPGKFFDELISIRPDMAQLGDCLNAIKAKEYEAATAAYQSIRKDFSDWWGRRMIKVAYVRMLVEKGDMDAAMDILELNDTWVFNYQLLKGDNALTPLRETERYQAYIKGNFPEK